MSLAAARHLACRHDGQAWATPDLSKVDEVGFADSAARKRPWLGRLRATSGASRSTANPCRVELQGAVLDIRAHAERGTRHWLPHGEVGHHARPYPLSLNALVNACNQKSSREPVMSLEPGIVERAVKDLIAKQLVMTQEFGSRVEKYQQRFSIHTSPRSSSRQPSSRWFACCYCAGRKHPASSKRTAAGCTSSRKARPRATIESLLTRADGPFVARLPREPRRKDHAYAHLFGGAIESAPRESRRRDSAEAPAARPSAVGIARSARREARTGARGARQGTRRRAAVNG